MKKYQQPTLEVVSMSKEVIMTSDPYKDFTEWY